MGQGRLLGLRGINLCLPGVENLPGKKDFHSLVFIKMNNVFYPGLPVYIPGYHFIPLVILSYPWLSFHNLDYPSILFWDVFWYLYFIPLNSNSKSLTVP